MPGARKAISEAWERALKGGLDMSHAARMKRAARQGFGSDDFVHVTPGAAFDAFDPAKGMSGPITGNPIAKHGHFFFKKSSMTPERAAPYMDGGGSSIPVKLRLKKPYELDMWGKEWAKLADDRGIVQEGLVDDFIAKIKKRGHDGIVLKGGDGYEEFMVFDPANIRSTNAAFDPANIGKSDILGSIDPKLLAGLAGAGAAAPTAIDAFKGGTEALGKGIYNMIPEMAGGILGQMGTATGADQPSMEYLQQMLTGGLGGLMGTAEPSQNAEQMGQQMIMDAYRGIQDFGENTYTGRAGKQIWDWLSAYYGQLPEENLLKNKQYTSALDLGL